MKSKSLECISLLLWGLAAVANAQPPTILLARHAERADSSSGSSPAMTKDPDLSAAGVARAESLGKMLKDAGIKAIFVTEYKRTQQTAAPLAKAAGIAITIVPAKETDALIAKLRSATGNALVIGHSNTLPEIIKALGVVESVTIADSDYDNLFVVMSGSSPQLIHLHY